MNRKHGGIWILVSIIIVSILITGCMEQPVTTHPENAQPEKSVEAANNRFAFDLYETLARDPANAGQNMFYSPYSISSALVVAGEGANG